MSQFSVYCCEIDMDFTAPGLWHLRQKKETKEKMVRWVDLFVMHSLSVTCTMLIPSPKKLQSTLAARSVPFRLKGRSLPALKCSHLWGATWWLPGSSCRSGERRARLDEHREVLEKQPHAIYIPKDCESVSYWVPSFHVLAPSSSPRGWKCGEKLMGTECSSRKFCIFSLAEGTFTSSMLWLRLHLYPVHVRQPICFTPSVWHAKPQCYLFG